MHETVRWGILGPGRIARKFALALRESEDAILAAVGSRSRDRAEAFAREYGAPTGHDSYEALAGDPQVDAVYVATPHPFHLPHTVLCLSAGKHVLCEKPLALNAAQGERMIEAAREADRLLMEAMWTRFLPTMARVRGLLAEGAIGEPRLLTADFGFRAPFDPASRLFDPALGGGALLDLGVYPLSLALMLFGEPARITSAVNLGTTGVDEEAAILLHHEHGEMAVLTASSRLATPGRARIHGTGGWIRIHPPWQGSTRLTVGSGDAEETLDLPHRGGGFAHQVEAFMDLLREGRRDSPVMPLAGSLAVMRTMDAMRAQWGLRYPGEEPPPQGWKPG
jgi:predicted dehydrogenase